MNLSAMDTIYFTYHQINDTRHFHFEYTIKFYFHDLSINTYKIFIRSNIIDHCITCINKFIQIPMLFIGL